MRGVGARRGISRRAALRTSGAAERVGALRGVAHEGIRERDVVGEVAVSERVVELVAIRVPAGEVAADGGDAPGRHRSVGRSLHRYLEPLAAHHRHRHEVYVVPDQRDCPVAARSDEDLVGRLGPCVRTASRLCEPRHSDHLPNVGSIEPHRNQAAAPVGDEDSACVLGEVRPSVGGERGNRRHRASAGRYPDQLHPVHALFLDARLLGPSRSDDAASGRRVVDAVVEGALAGEALRPGGAARIGADAVDVAPFLRPRHVRHVTSIRRPDWRVLTHFHISQAAGSAVRQIHDPQPVERGERQPLAVRRGARVPDLPHGEHRVVELVIEMHEWTQLLLDVGGERDLGHRAGGDLDPLDLAVPRGDQCRSIRSER